ncbi:30460_t:CDS:2 [Gigaspora margarita]|uniref:30460_t:CDS:1 n=1 Tax=Gigaspora margarita TaxID=4874 RepID=A0ABN7VEI9_GIGMA|nr:30460_t:CDS:2 [Gigaspora margarita]
MRHGGYGAIRQFGPIQKGDSRIACRPDLMFIAYLNDLFNMEIGRPNLLNENRNKIVES